MIQLKPLQISDYICREFDLDQEELKLLALCEEILKPPDKASPPTP